MKHRFNKLLILSSFSISLIGVSCTQNRKVNIKFLATSDMHGMMLPFDYALDTEVNTGSFAQIATLINNLRNDNTIVLDVGDMSQGNYTEMFKTYEQHPMFGALNLMNYDVFVVGNHEFNHGLDFLQRQLKTFKGAALCGNVFNKETKKTLEGASPYKIIEKDGVKVAIIGMVSPCITKWDGDKLTAWDVVDPIITTNNAITEIKEGKKADIIVAAEHMGLHNEYGVSGSSVTEIAKNCPGLDLIIGAHEHTSVAQEVEGVYVVENKNSCQTLAEVNLEIEGKPGNYKVKKKEGIIHNLKEEQPEVDTKVKAYFEPFDNLCKIDAHTVVGKLTNGPLAREYEIKKVPSMFIEPTPLAHLVNQTHIYEAKKSFTDKTEKAKVRVSATSIGNYNANIKETERDIKKCDVSLIYKFVNTLYVLEMNGKQLKQYIEFITRFINQYEDGDLTISFSSEIPSYNFDMFYGVDFKIDINKKIDSGNRIKELKWSDTKEDVKESDEFYIAVNNYRANTQLLSDVIYGSDPKPKLIKSDVSGGTGVREMIITYIQEGLGGVVDTTKNGLDTKNWEIITPNWNIEDHNEAVKRINNGEIDIGETNTKRVKKTW